MFTYEDFLIFPCYSPELCIPLCISFLFSFAFHFSYFLSCFFLFVCFLNVELYLFFFFFSKFYLILFFNFTILYWVCHISKWIHHRYICVPHPEPSSLLPPHTIPLGRPLHQPQASSIVHQTWTGNTFHIWYYTCFNAILLNNPTLFLSNRVQKTVLYICVSLAVSLTGLLLPFF